MAIKGIHGFKGIHVARDLSTEEMQEVIELCSPGQTHSTQPDETEEHVLNYLHLDSDCRLTRK